VYIILWYSIYIYNINYNTLVNTHGNTVLNKVYFTYNTEKKVSFFTSLVDVYINKSVIKCVQSVFQLVPSHARS